jgi:hypothetical protein
MITLYIEDMVTGKSYMNIMDFSPQKFPVPRIGEQISILVENNQNHQSPALFEVVNIIHHYRSLFELYKFNIQILVKEVGRDYGKTEIEQKL